ncbi:MAG: hypothetical protein QF467_06300, partial [SAR202 cluster bacterium]|nr:hypothetical protein [SAR202 cluster bacterium]
MAQETLTKKAVRAPVFGALLLAVAFAFTLILGCGGGGSDESTSVPEATPEQVVGYAQTDDESVILYPDRPDAQDDDTELAEGPRQVPLPAVQDPAQRDVRIVGAHLRGEGGQ